MPLTLFQATLTPHRSLSPRGLLMVAGAILAASIAINGVFITVGAWPVAGFSGVEIGLALLLLRLHARIRRRAETILLTDTEAVVTTTSKDGTRRTHTLPIGWLRVELTERPARVPALNLRHRDAAIEVGSELGEDDKRALAQALEQALHRARSPVFDNPQLREGA